MFEDECMDIKIFLITSLKKDNRYLIWSDSEDDIENNLPPCCTVGLAQLDTGQDMPVLSSDDFDWKKRCKVFEITDFEYVKEEILQDINGKKYNLLTIKYKDFLYDLVKNEPEQDHSILKEALHELKKSGRLKSQ